MSYYGGYYGLRVVTVAVEVPAVDRAEPVEVVPPATVTIARVDHVSEALQRLAEQYRIDSE